MSKTLAEQEWMERVAGLGCVICRRLYGHYVPSQLHHVAEGSGLRSNFAIAPLCMEHHTGRAGFHWLGTKAFCRLYRIPGETEYGLLVLVNEDLASLLANNLEIT